MVCRPGWRSTQSGQSGSRFGPKHPRKMPQSRWRRALACPRGDFARLSVRHRPMVRAVIAHCIAISANTSRGEKCLDRRRDRFGEQPGARRPHAFSTMISLSTSRNAVTVRVVESITCRRLLAVHNGLSAGPVDTLPIRLRTGLRDHLPLRSQAVSLGLYESSDDEQTWDWNMDVPHTNRWIETVSNRHRRQNALDRVPRSATGIGGTPRDRPLAGRPVPRRLARCSAGRFAKYKRDLLQRLRRHERIDGDGSGRRMPDGD